MRARSLTRLLAISAVVLSVVVAAPPSVADEVNVQLHIAVFGGSGVVDDIDGSDPEVNVAASSSQCDAVVLVGGVALRLPCEFEFDVPLNKASRCTGTATGPATLTVELPYPYGFRHDFVYDAVAVVDETSIHGFGTTELDIPNLSVRTGWTRFDAAPPKCNVPGPNVGTAVY